MYCLLLQASSFHPSFHFSYELIFNNYNFCAHSRRVCLKTIHLLSLGFLLGDLLLLLGHAEHLSLGFVPVDAGLLHECLRLAVKQVVISNGLLLCSPLSPVQCSAVSLVSGALTAPCLSRSQLGNCWSKASHCSPSLMVDLDCLWQEVGLDERV